MPGTHIALLRGINVGRAKRVAMADLRTLVESLGYSDVRTLLNSGNVVFTARVAAATAATRIEKALVEELGVSSRVLVFTGEELATVVAENPLTETATDPTRLLVAFLASRKDRDKLEPSRAEAWTPEALALGTRVAYLWCPGGVLESGLVKAVGRALGDSVTMRNWATVLKLQSLVQAG